MLVFPEPGSDDVGGSTGERGAAEIVIHVFALNRPVWCEHVFETAADGVTVAMRTIDRKAHRNATSTRADTDAIAPGVTALGVNQRRTPSVTNPASHRAEFVGIAGYGGSRQR